MPAEALPETVETAVDEPTSPLLATAVAVRVALEPTGAPEAALTLNSATQVAEPAVQPTEIGDKTEKFALLLASESVDMVWPAGTPVDAPVTVTLNDVPSTTLAGTPEVETVGTAAMAAGASISMLTTDIKRTTKTLLDTFIFKPPQTC